MRFKSILIGVAAAIIISVPAFAQGDEIIVTATKRMSYSKNGIQSTPGITMIKKGDFLLMDITVENDSRDYKDRYREIRTTIEAILEAAEDAPKIELSIVSDNNIVRPLTLGNFDDGLRGAGRPDTSRAFIKAKTAIPKQVDDSYALVKTLTDFADSLDEIETAGRSTIDYDEDVTVSIIDPQQYRPELVKIIIADINGVKSALGNDYKAVVSGLDQGMTWSRSGDLNLAFALPYSYEIVPGSLAIYIGDGAVKISDDY